MAHELLHASVTVPAGNTVANTTTETTFGQAVPLPAFQPGHVGKAYRFTGYASVSTDGTTPGTLTLRLKLGSTTLGSSGAITLPASLANALVKVEGVVVVVSTGTSGTCECQGLVYVLNGAAVIAAGIVNTAVVTSVNTDAASNLGVSAQFSAASATNTITLRQLVVERMD